MPDITPLLNADTAIQIHVACALLAVGLAPVQLLRRRRDRLHKTLGYIWVTAMAGTALSSFAISEIRLVGRFSPIHLLSLLTLAGLAASIIQVRRGRIDAHRRTMRSMCFWALGLAGLFTLLPGRVMSGILFGQWQVTGFGITTLVAAGFLVSGILADRRAASAPQAQGPRGV